MMAVSKEVVDPDTTEDKLSSLTATQSENTKISNILKENNRTSNQLNVPTVQNLPENSREKRNDSTKLSNLEREESETSENSTTQEHYEPPRSDLEVLDTDNGGDGDSKAKTILKKSGDSAQDSDGSIQEETSVANHDDYKPRKTEPQLPFTDGSSEPRSKPEFPSYPTISVVQDALSYVDQNQNVERIVEELLKDDDGVEYVNYTESVSTSHSSTPASDHSDGDTDEYSDTEDQRRALLELRQQEEEYASSVDCIPPQYNVKERLQLLNQELAEEMPDNSNRPTKVAFREDLVQTCSPVDQITDAMAINEDVKETDESISTSQQNKPLDGMYDMVVERDGRFDVVTPEDMTALIANLKQLPPPFEKGKKESTKSRRAIDACNRGRPKTATTAAMSKKIIPQSRPFSSGNLYHSPYGLSPEQKEAVRKRLQLMEQQKRLTIEENKAREREKRMENEQAFDAWLNGIREKEIAAKKTEELTIEMQKAKEEEEKMKNKLKGEFYKKWVQQKHKQQKQEQLFRCQQEEEINRFKKSRSQEEIERAYRRWLKNKSLENKKQKFLAKQKSRLQQRLLHRSRIIRNMTWDVYLNNSFRYADHYGLGC